MTQTLVDWCYQKYKETGLGDMTYVVIADALAAKDKELAAQGKNKELERHIAQQHYWDQARIAELEAALAAKDEELGILVEHLRSMDFPICPVCYGWEVTKGEGCQREVHTKNCWLAIAIDKERKP